MKRYHHYFLALLSVALIATPALAQDDNEDEDQVVTTTKKKAPVKLPTYPMKEVRGYVFDAVTKAPLAGILVKTLNNVNYTAMSEEDGSFVIKVPTFSTSLFVHAPQYMSQQVAVGDTVFVEMLPDKFRSMYEDGTTIIASATQTIHNTTSQTVESDIEDVLGADVRSITRSGGPGYGTAMFIRGLNSLNANAQPLIVIDGVIQDMQQTRQALHEGDYTNLLLNINPEDVEKVTVLKNATALYGAKGGNGVVLIETKRGHSMATRIDANVGIGMTLKPRTPSVMDAEQYRLYASEMLGTYPNYTDYLNSSIFRFLIDDPSKYYYATYHNETNWKKEVYRTALTQNYNINVQGGDNIGMYNLSLGYTDGKSTAKENGFNRLNVRFNTDINILKRLTTRFDMSYAKVNRDVFDNGAPQSLTSGTVASPTFLALIKSPFLNPYTYNNVTRQLSSTLSEADDYLTMLDQDLSLGNPTALLANGKAINKNRVETTHFNAVIEPRINLGRNFILTETFSYTLDRISQRYYRPKNGMPTFMIEGIGRVQNKAMSMFSKETAISSDTRLTWSKQLHAHHVNAFAGFRFNNFSYDDNEPEGQYASAGNDKTPNVSASMDYIDATGANDQWRNMTYYAHVDYNYRNRYFVEASLAMEASSRFGKKSRGVKMGGVKWGLFPSIQAGWVLTNESWFPKGKGINYLQLHAGFDLSGNDDINNYAARTSFGVSKYLFRSTAAQLNNIGNEEITWEQTRKLNVGLKIYGLNNRIGLNLDFFMNHTSDLLTLKHFDNPVAGINSYWSNGGSLDNKGYELTLTGKPIVSKNLNLELGVSLGRYVNKVKSLPDNNLIYVGGEKTAQGYTSSIYGTDNIATIVGQPLGLFYGYRTNGVFATDADAKAAGKGGYLYLIDNTNNPQYFKAGDVHFEDLNGDGVIGEEDKTIIGNPNPDVYGNIFANLSWKNLTLFIGLNYSVGNDVFNYQRSILEGGSNFYNQTTAMTNRWRAEGQQTSVPRIYYGDPMGNSRFSDRWIEDGSYLRLKTVRLSYKIPVSLSWLQGLAVWAEANNLLTFTKYLGNDPEFSASNSVLYQGIDPGNVAIGRAFTMGLRINL